MAANATFSGLAFLGTIWALLLQTHQMKSLRDEQERMNAQQSLLLRNSSAQTSILENSSRLGALEALLKVASAEITALQVEKESPSKYNELLEWKERRQRLATDLAAEYDKLNKAT